jgi:uncharacterized protein YdaU (DUF1376 family)
MKKSTQVDQWPYMPFFVNDWLGDDALRACSPASRGIWIDMLAIMWKSPQRGVLLKANGRIHTSKTLAKRLGDAVADIEAAFAELKEEEVYSERDDGAIYCRRMWREWDVSQKRARAGSKGGKASKTRPKGKQPLNNSSSLSTASTNKKRAPSGSKEDRWKKKKRKKKPPTDGSGGSFNG